MSERITMSHGRIEYRNEFNELHREGDKPAVISIRDNRKEWWENGVRHRGRGRPAIVAPAYEEHWVRGVRSIPQIDIVRAMSTLNDRLEEEDGRLVVYKGTKSQGHSPVYPGLSSCGCGEDNTFDYQVGYSYYEPHATGDFTQDCGAGINVSPSIRGALHFGRRVVKCLVSPDDIDSFAVRQLRDGRVPDTLKIRATEIEVVEELSQSCNACEKVSSGTDEVYDIAKCHDRCHCGFNRDSLCGADNCWLRRTY